MTIATGTRLGRYEVRSQLGAGGMGEVYLARDPKLGRDAAIKVLPAEFSADADRLARFEQEACAASALNHPNIITIYEIGQSASLHFIVAELISVTWGDSMKHWQRLSARKRLILFRSSSTPAWHALTC